MKAKRSGVSCGLTRGREREVKEGRLRTGRGGDIERPSTQGWQWSPGLHAGNEMAAAASDGCEQSSLCCSPRPEEIDTKSGVGAVSVSTAIHVSRRASTTTSRRANYDLSCERPVNMFIAISWWRCVVMNSIGADRSAPALVFGNRCKQRTVRGMSIAAGCVCQRRAAAGGCGRRHRPRLYVEHEQTPFPLCKH